MLDQHEILYDTPKYQKLFLNAVDKFMYDLNIERVLEDGVSGVRMKEMRKLIKMYLRYHYYFSFGEEGTIYGQEGHLQFPVYYCQGIKTTYQCGRINISTGLQPTGTVCCEDCIGNRISPIYVISETGIKKLEKGA